MALCSRRFSRNKGTRVLSVRSPAPHSMATILLVEDNDDVREMMALALQLDGHRVCAAANGREALAHLRNDPKPCLILLDLMMPVMNGWELRASLNQDPELRDIPIVVVSAVTAEIAHRLHDTAFVSKPVDIDRLLEMVCTYCRENDEPAEERR
jgi:CheY-like chemotaxis protein